MSVPRRAATGGIARMSPANGVRGPDDFVEFDLLPCNTCCSGRASYRFGQKRTCPRTRTGGKPKPPGHGRTLTDMAISWDTYRETRTSIGFVPLSSVHRRPSVFSEIRRRQPR